MRTCDRWGKAMAKWKVGDRVVTRGKPDTVRTVSVVFQSGNVRLDGGEYLVYFPDDVSPALTIVPGVGPDAETITNAAGAKQSATTRRLDLVPPLAILAVGEVLHHGAKKYGADNWRGIPVAEHLNHLLIHTYAYLAGDQSDDHLSHVACRALMAMEAPHETPTTTTTTPDTTA